ncbi:MAG: hypothetical protein BJG00_008105 [Limnothrix sp. CACIAM 69d]|nr:MAG: hypothetical protein BJG00_008105 [Limnothrix sp. CACIAM 69d]
MILKDEPLLAVPDRLDQGHPIVTSFQDGRLYREFAGGNREFFCGWQFTRRDWPAFEDRGLNDFQLHHRLHHTEIQRPVILNWLQLLGHASHQ